MFIPSHDWSSFLPAQLYESLLLDKKSGLDLKGPEPKHGAKGCPLLLGVLGAAMSSSTLATSSPLLRFNVAPLTKVIPSCPSKYKRTKVGQKEEKIWKVRGKNTWK